jgi:hypothetical protein
VLGRGEEEVSPTTLVEDPKLAALAQQYAEKEPPLPLGRSGVVTAACLAATRYRIIHGRALEVGE